jgi:hypothetical protein
VQKRLKKLIKTNMDINRIISESINLILEKKNSIHIKKKNKGKFNALKKRTGKSTEELTHSKNPLTRKRAIFAQNAKKWHHKGKKKKINEENEFNLSYERELAQRLAEVGGGSLTDKERELLRNAGYTFNTISGPGYRVTDILLNGRRVAKTINGKTKWY